ncbi:MAG: hypothetical protein ACOCUU_02630, partial [Nanoarchaeota archaeon]
EDNSIKVKSAGLFPGNIKTESFQKRVKIFSKLGIDINGKIKPITTHLLRWQDMIIIVADDVPPSLFKNKMYNNKVIVWKIKDHHGDSLTAMRSTLKQIIKKVDDLYKKLL